MQGKIFILNGFNHLRRILSKLFILSVLGYKGAWRCWRFSLALVDANHFKRVGFGAQGGQRLKASSVTLVAYGTPFDKLRAGSEGVP